MEREIVFYETANGNSPVEKFLRSLTEKEQTEVFAVFELIETTKQPSKNVFKKMVNTDDLWEARVKVGGRIFRLLGFFDGGRLVVLSHGFQKKTQKTEKQDIRTAEKRKKDYFRRK